MNPQPRHKLNKGLIKSVENIHDEFVKGFEFASKIEKGVSIFGSGRLPKTNFHYKQAKELAKLLAENGYPVITGGGPAIMEAANHGAYLGGGRSIGLNIIIPQGQSFNDYVKEGITLNYFYTRKVMFAIASDYYVFFPGGFGTLDEFFEIVNIIHNRKIKTPPLTVMMGRDYWDPLLNFLRETALKKHGTIEVKDFKIFNIVDTPREALKLIKNYKIKK